MLSTLVGIAARPAQLVLAPRDLDPRTQTLAGEVAPFWPCKNGDNNHTGASTYVAPSNLTAGPVWRWVSDYPKDVVRAAPLIDSAGNLYQATVTSGRVIKFALDGTVLWRYSTVGAPSNNAVTPDEIPEVPALLGSALYLITANGFIIALDQATGTEHWRVAAHDHMPGDTFAITAGLGVVIAATRGGASPANGGEAKLLAVDAATGSKKWDFDMGSEPAYNILVSLLKPVGADAVVVFQSSLGSVYKVDLATGKQIWKVPGASNAAFSTGGSIIGPDDTIYVTGNKDVSGNTHGLVTAYELGSGALKWQVDLGAPWEANVAASIGRVGGPGTPLAVVVAVGPNNAATPLQFMGLKPTDGTNGPPLGAKTIALDAATGNIVWTYDMPTWHGGNAGDNMGHICLPDESANVAIGADGFVYVPHLDGRIYSIKDADSDGTISAGEVDWFDFKMGFQGSPAIAPDVLAIAPCDGMAVFMTPEGQLRAKQSRRS